jgi:hypothetical protein
MTKSRTKFHAAFKAKIALEGPRRIRTAKHLLATRPISTSSTRRSAATCFATSFQRLLVDCVESAIGAQAHQD